MQNIAFWFRRDLRLHDNHGLYQALKNGQQVLPVFIFDPQILNKLTDKRDRRVDFIHRRLNELDRQLRQNGFGGLLVVHGDVEKYWQKIIKMYEIDAIYCNHDYEPQAINRDRRLEQLCYEQKTDFKSFKDQVVFEEDEVIKNDGTPYTVFTPYKKRWLSSLTESDLQQYPSENNLEKMWRGRLPMPYELDKIGFQKSDVEIPPHDINFALLKDYHLQRDFPALGATSHLSVHLRFGTVSIRHLVKEAQKVNDTWLSELIWREFFMMILYHFPHSVSSEFKPAYSQVPWRHEEEDFKKWCFGETGYPLVDAGMRELNSTGFMHNRVRMVTASFLVKHLLIDWRWGECYFAKKLLDYDLSANVGNWQWAAGCGCDAAPYFRVFNPEAQAQKFDRQNEYIQRWIPEYGTSEYPEPMVDHKTAREKAISVYKKALS